MVIRFSVSVFPSNNFVAEPGASEMGKLKKLFVPGEFKNS